MPALQRNSGALVLVTGASGFLGTHTITELLNTGFKVRGTVRSSEKGNYLLSLFRGQEVDYAVVPDMNEPGAYDQAVEGVDAVIHVASPVDVLNQGHPSLVIGPAVRGTIGLLESLRKYAPDVQRVVNVSSIAAVAMPEGGSKIMTEDDWNETAVDIVTHLGKDAPGLVKYLASKTLAERAFWDYFKNNITRFDGVATLPGAIFGAPTQFGTDLPGTTQMILPWLQGPMPESQLHSIYYNLVHVSDAARANVRALTVPEAGGERFLIISDQLFANDVALAAQQFPELDVLNLTKGNPDPAFRQGIATRAVDFDGSKSIEILGLQYKDRFEVLPESIRTAIPVVLSQQA